MGYFVLVLASRGWGQGRGYAALVLAWRGQGGDTLSSSWLGVV